MVASAGRFVKRDKPLSIPLDFLLWVCSDYRLRVVLCYVDVEDNVKPLHEINRLALLEKCTLLLAWSKEEAGR